MTISWCYFHDHHKGCLSGSGNSDNYDRKSTLHHNLFDNISSRIPLQRYGKLHLLNNYVVNSENGLNVRIQSEALAEKNYFKNTKKPIFGKVSEGGSASEIDNYFDNCSRLSWVHIPSASSPDADALSASEEYNPNNYVIPYDYSNYVTAVADVPDVVSEWAGIGKIPFDPMTLAIGENDDASGVTVTPSIVIDVLLISINADAGFVSLITIADINGHVVLKKKESIVVGKNEIKLDMRHVKSGYYFCQVPTGKGTAVQKVFKRGN